MADNKYKIIDIDGSEIELEGLLEKYFFNSNQHHTACSVILTRSYNNTIEHYSILEQTNGIEKEQNVDSKNPSNRVENYKTDNITLSNPSTYEYTKADIENFFASDNGQEEYNSLEESICRPLIGQQSNKPFFYYCKEDPKVENIN